METLKSIAQPTPMKGLNSAVITSSAQPTRMSRSGGNGPKGSGNSLPPNRGDYGLGLGKEVVRMKRSVPAGPSGKNWNLTADGPARSGRSPKANFSHMGRDYGIAGVTGNGGGGYGVGGI